MRQNEPRPGQEEHEGPVGTALSTAVSGNATAFGFSVTITVTFGVVEHFRGSPTLLELLLFGIAGALSVGILEGLVTRGFRRRVGAVPSEVTMLGTSLDVVSVSAGVGAAMLVGALLHGVAAWPAGSFTAAATYMLVQTGEILLAETIQRRRGDPGAQAEKT